MISYTLSIINVIKKQLENQIMAPFSPLVIDGDSDKDLVVPNYSSLS